MDNPRLWICERFAILRYLPWLEEAPLVPKLAIALESFERLNVARSNVAARHPGIGVPCRAPGGWVETWNVLTF
jgi:hypothetical protein